VVTTVFSNPGFVTRLGGAHATVTASSSTVGLASAVDVASVLVVEYALIMHTASAL
jgi:hypothetical protein